MTSRFVGLLNVILFFSTTIFSQKITFSQPDREDARTINFDIVGKMDGNTLVYKSYGTNYFICVFDDDMKQIAKNSMSFLPGKIINSDILAYKNFFYFIYQYQKRNIVYCMAAKMNEQGIIEGQPKQLDTTAISFFATNKIYSVINSENKTRIDVLKINSNDPDNYFVTNALFDADLNLLSKTRSGIPMPQRNEYLNEFQIDNDGNVIFLRGSGTSQNSNVNQLTLIIKNFNDSTVSFYDINNLKEFLDASKIKIDNHNKHYLIASFYSKTRRGNIDGMYLNVWSPIKNSSISSKYITFSEDLRAQAKSKDDNSKMAFDDNFIQSIIMRKDGGFIIVSESATSTTHGNPFNHWDYLYGDPFAMPGDYYYYNYSPYSYYYPWYLNSPNYLNNATRYFADNITVFSFDSSINSEWSTVVHKSQFDDNTDNFLGFTILNTGQELHFLFNQLLKRQNLLTDQSVTPDGQLHLMPTLHNLDNGFEFMPRFAKQTDAQEVVFPCNYRNSICFAKVDF